MLAPLPLSFPLLACALAPALPAQFHDDFSAAKLDPAWTWTDPGKDCSYKLIPATGTLQMSVPPGNDHTTGHAAPLYAGPKLTLKTSGDFTITTHVRVNYPRAPSTMESGLMIWQSSSNNLQFKRTNGFNSQNVLLYGNLNSARTAMASNVATSASSIYLRIVRAGKVFTASFSTDGRTWSKGGSVTWNPTGTVEVGIATSFWLWWGSTKNPALGDYSFFDLDKAPSDFSADRAGLSAASGGTVGLAAKLPAARAGDVYLMLGSVSGSKPGIALPGGATLPLNPDIVFNLMSQLPGTPGLFPGTVGILNANGQGMGSVVVPAGVATAWVGRSARFAALILPTKSGSLAATKAAEVAVIQ